MKEILEFKHKKMWFMVDSYWNCTNSSCHLWR